MSHSGCWDSMEGCGGSFAWTSPRSVSVMTRDVSAWFNANLVCRSVPSRYRTRSVRFRWASASWMNAYPASAMAAIKRRTGTVPAP